jgi:hypothetical protein
MADLPPEAVEDAAAPIAEMFPGLGLETARKIATMALEAAYPHIRAQVLRDTTREQWGDAIRGAAADYAEQMKATALQIVADATDARLATTEALVRAAERGRIRDLAIDKRAEYRTPPCTNPGCPAVVGEHVHVLPFADLIGSADG